MEILWGSGFNRMGEVIDLAEELEVFSKSGSHYSYGDQKLANGYDNMMEFMRNNEEFYQEIEQKVLQAINPDTVTAEK